MFQIVRLALDDNGEVTARRPLQPCFELWEDAIAMAEFDASRLWGDYGCDQERDCWWATDTRGRKYRFVIEQIRPTGLNWAQRPGIVPAAAIFAGPIWQVMPITQFLNSPKFDPETKRIAGVAFEMARAALQLDEILVA